MPIVSIPLTARGLAGSGDPSRLATGDLIRAENVEFGATGLVQKEPGAAKRNATALSGLVLAGIDWYPTDSTHRTVVATADGKLLKDDLTGAFATTLATGLQAARVTSFAEGGAESAGRSRKLFSSNGFDAPRVLAADGAAAAALTTPPADWSGANQPAWMAPFDLYMTGGGNGNDPNRVYVSTTADHENFTGAGSGTLSVYPGSGRKLVAAIAAFGRFWLFKYPRGVFWISDATAGVANWRSKPTSFDGGAAPTAHAVTLIGDPERGDSAVAFVANNGDIVLMQETAGTEEGVAFTNLTKTLGLRDVIRQNFHLARLDRTQIRWDDELKHLHVLFAGLGSVVEDRRLVLDFNAERIRAEISTKQVNTAIWMEQNRDGVWRPMIGDDAGFVWELDQVDRNVDVTTAIAMALRTAPTDLSDADASYAGRKLFSYLHMEYVPSATFDVSADVYVDGKLIGTVPFSQGVGGAALPFTLPHAIGGAELLRRTRDIAGEGYYLSVQLRESGLNNNPRIARLWAEFDLVGMRR